MSLYNTLTQPLLNIGSDKYLHFIISALLAFGLTICLGWAIGVLITFFIGALKEIVIDLAIRKQYIDGQDLIADAAGAVIGMVMAIL